MKKIILSIVLFTILFIVGCSKNEKEAEVEGFVEEKTAEQVQMEVVDTIINTMEIEEKVGQLFMIDFRKNKDGSEMQVMQQEVIDAIQEYHLGGVILFAENLDTQDQTVQLIQDMQEVADLSLFIGVDEEGGLVSRLGKSQIPHKKISPAGELTDEEVVESGTIIGKKLMELGINVNFAPIADVNTNPENTVISTRAFSKDPKIAAQRVGAFINALEKTGVSATAKHFPGHGDTLADSHKGQVSVVHTMERLRKSEFLPFKSAIEAGVDMIMLGHIHTPNATNDGLPATLSSEMIGILREELGFSGIIITDAMEMEAITKYYDSGEAAVLAILAGVDIVLMPFETEEAYEAVVEAVKIGEISEERINESIKRILNLKYEKGML